MKRLRLRDERDIDRDDERSAREADDFRCRECEAPLPLPIRGHFCSRCRERD